MPAFSFYKNVVPLNSNVHSKLRFKPAVRFRFSEKVQSVAIGAGEFFDCAVEYPIVFVRAQQSIIPVALLGARPDENLFVNEDGKWDTHYVPVFIRRYPFVTLHEQDQRLSVGIDDEYSGFTEKDGEGERILQDDGQPSEAFKPTLEFLNRAHAEYVRGEGLAKLLDEKGLLQPMSANMSIEGGASVQLSGFEVVDVAKLDAMSIGEQGLLAKSGDLALIHAHLVSLRNFRKLLARVEQRLATASTASTAASAPAQGQADASSPAA